MIAVGKGSEVADVAATCSMVNPSNSAHRPGRLPAVFFLCFLLGTMPVDSSAWAMDSKNGEPAYSMGMFPALSPGMLADLFGPIAYELSQALGREVQFGSTSSYEKFGKRLESAEYDIALVHPWDYVNIASRVGYLPVVARNGRLYAVFVVKRDSPLKNAGDLKGKIVGLPPRIAVVSHLARIALHEAGIEQGRDLTLRYFSSHESCLQQLQIGDIDTCVSAMATLRVYQAKTRNAFRVLMESPSIPEIVFVVHSRVPGKDRDVIKKTLLSTTLGGIPPPTRDLFFEKNSKDGRYFRSVRDSEYDPVRRYIKILKDLP